MYILFIVLILIASLLIVFAVLMQNPKGGMAANFGASNQVMGVRKTADFLEKATWTLSISIVVLSLLATMTMPSSRISQSKSGLEKAIENSGAKPSGNFMPNQTAPAPTTAPTTAPAAQPVAPTQE